MVTENRTSWTHAALGAALVVAAAGAARADIVSGTVRGEDGSPVAAANLDFIDAAGTNIPVSNDGTDVLGGYAVDVPPGTYEIDYKAPTGSPWANRKVVGVVVSGPTARPDVILPYGHAVSGLVVNESMVPVPNVDLDFKDPVTGQDWYTRLDDTDLSGSYSTIVPAGTWDIEYAPAPGDPYAVELVCGVVVTGPQVRPTVVLRSAWRVRAFVKTTGGAPVVDADTKFYDQLGQPVPTVNDHTDATGMFQAWVAPGTYDIEVRPPAGSRLLATVVQDVVVTLDTTLPDIILEQGLLVTGRVRNAAGTYLAGVDTDWNTAAGVALTPTDDTDDTGTYSVAVPADTYAIDFDPPVGTRYASAQLLDVVIATDTTLPDVVLLAGWYVDGRVTDAAGQPVADVVTAVTDTVSGTPHPGGADVTGPDGRFRWMLPDGAHDASFTPPVASGLLPLTRPGLVVAGADQVLGDVVLQAPGPTMDLLVNATITTIDGTTFTVMRTILRPGSDAGPPRLDPVRDLAVAGAVLPLVRDGAALPVGEGNPGVLTFYELAGDGGMTVRIDKHDGDGDAILDDLLIRE